MEKLIDQSLEASVLSFSVGEVTTGEKYSQLFLYNRSIKRARLVTDDVKSEIPQIMLWVCGKRSI